MLACPNGVFAKCRDCIPCTEATAEVTSRAGIRNTPSRRRTLACKSGMISPVSPISSESHLTYFLDLPATGRDLVLIRHALTVQDSGLNPALQDWEGTGELREPTNVPFWQVLV
jgi:hypothetical protein